MASLDGWCPSEVVQGTAVTPREWLLVRLDDPPQVFVARNPAGGAWQVMVRIDGGYGDKADAAAAAARLGRELRWMQQHARDC